MVNAIKKPLDIWHFSDARLITVDEYNDIVGRVPNVPIEMPDKWWTSTAQENRTFCCVSADGDIIKVGVMSRCGIRPLYIIKGDYNLKPGDKVNVYCMPCTVTDVLTDTDGTAINHAFADEFVSFGTRYDADDAHYL